ncbi:MAG TPA: transporter substrate-binding domain-containing protein, partial [Casimicrobiaceae bacterium]|nr:transporter substrate-binding domain-containing protein [Casimicrobiaceae bacterium]
MSRAGKLVFAVLVACASMIGTTSSAQDAIGVEQLTGTLKKIRTTGAVTIGFRDASVPFSYVGPGRKPIGYSIDLCLAIVDAIKAELGMEDLQIKYLPVNPQTRIPMV